MYSIVSCYYINFSQEYNLRINELNSEYQSSREIYQSACSEYNL